MIALIIVALVLIGLVVDVALVRWWMNRLRNEAINALCEAVGRERVYRVENCNFLGWQSRGYLQVRGNGLVALTDRGIHFHTLLPRRYLFIPQEEMSSASVVDSFLGKPGRGKILRVDFRTAGGGEDACGWRIPYPDWWVEALLAIREGRRPPSPPPG
ncbi:MAG: hypothetical protein ACUVS1_04575 [Actinomycetota bacterium]